MRHHRYALLAIAFVAGVAPSANSLDFSKVTCRAFLGSGQANMAAIIMWLRGYHAGKSGTIAYQSGDPYPARLGQYCGSHPLDNLIDTSERILSELDRGI